MRSRRAGFTLLEVLIAITILGLIGANLGMVMRTSEKAAETDRILSELDGQADQTIDRIGLALMSASAPELDPIQLAPLNSHRIDYRASLGIDLEGDMELGDEERIELITDAGQVVWRENPGAAAERSVVWSNHVPELLENEELNGFDDNSNVVIDERGLSFNVQGDQVVIRLTLERTDSGGRLFQKTVEQRVTCRN